MTLLSVLILLGTVQGLIVTAALVRIRDRNRAANRTLSAFILLISLVLLSRLVYVEGISIIKGYPHLYLIPDIPLFLYGPMFFLYVRDLLHQNPSGRRRTWLHFVPALLHMLVMSVYLFESREEYGRRLQENNLIELPLAPILALLQSGIYLIAGYVIFRRYRTQSAQVLSHNNSMRGLQTIFGLIALCWFAWLVSALDPAITDAVRLPAISYNIAWVALSFTTLFLGYYAIVQPDVFRLQVSRTRYEKSNLSSSRMDELEENLRTFMNTQKPYLNPTLSLAELARLIGIPQKDLSRLINERFGMNFFDFINRFRVEEFKQLSTKEQYRNLTVLAIALDAGFNSKTTFNNAFKRHVRLTPSQFVKGSR